MSPKLSQRNFVSRDEIYGWFVHNLGESRRWIQLRHSLGSCVMNTLPPDEAALFFRLMWALQFYVNQQLKIVRGPKSAAAYAKLGTQKKYKVREALYQHKELIETFVAENPAGLAPEELSIVATWKRCVVGDFYIDRFLKRHTIFISGGKDERVYGVLGLYEPLEDVAPDWPLPIYVQAVLLPFRGRIIYDGLLAPYSVTFGAGIRGDLNEIYQRAKQAGRIVESLEAGVASARAVRLKKPARDWGPVLDGLVETIERLRQADGPVQARAFGVLKASARLAQAACPTAEEPGRHRATGSPRGDGAAPSGDGPGS